MSRDVWRSGLSELVRRVVSDDRTRLGVYLPRAADLAPLLRCARCGRSAREKLKMQWLSGVAGGPASAGLAPGITCDCSLDVDGADPYITDRPYLPLAFDVRVPTFAVGGGGLVAVPRVDGGRASGTALTRLGSRDDVAGADGGAGPPPAARTSRSNGCRHRLRAALDLPRRQAYLRELESNRRAVDRWHEYHVYNWPAPPAAIHRLDFVRRCVADGSGFGAARAPGSAARSAGHDRRWVHLEGRGRGPPRAVRRRSHSRSTGDRA